MHCSTEETQAVTKCQLTCRCYIILDYWWAIHYLLLYNYMYCETFKYMYVCRRYRPTLDVLRPIMKMTHVLEQTCDGLGRLFKIRRVWLKHWKSCLNVSLALCQTHCRKVPVFSRLSRNHLIMWCYHTPQFLPTGQYGLCFGYSVSGPLPLRSHKRQVTFYGAI